MNNTVVSSQTSSQTPWRTFQRYQEDKIHLSQPGALKFVQRFLQACLCFCFFCEQFNSLQLEVTLDYQGDAMKEGRNFTNVNNTFESSQEPRMSSQVTWRTLMNKTNYWKNCQGHLNLSSTSQLTSKKKWFQLSKLEKEFCIINMYLALHMGLAQDKRHFHSKTFYSDLEKVIKCPQAENLELYYVLKIAGFPTMNQIYSY